jgi:predicted transcriptional regulator
VNTRAVFPNEAQGIPSSKASRDKILKILWNATAPITLSEVSIKAEMDDASALVVLNALRSRRLANSTQFKGKLAWFPR